MKVISFQKAIERSEECKIRHLLLGNGFSISCDPNIFTYQSIYKETDFTKHPQIKKCFELLETTNFELVIDTLERGSRIMPAYLSKHLSTSKKMVIDASAIKQLLIATISTRHPSKPSDITPDKYDKCRRFLKHFIHESNKGGKLYSLNYDLLLYWTLMHELDDPERKTKFNDGFGRDAWTDGGKVSVSDYLCWQGKTPFQNIHYLHGALHLFDHGHELQKFSWVDTKVRLIDQCRKALNENKFPLFVTEGDNLKKMEKINHSAYLHNSFQSFEDVVKGGKSKKPGNTCLFTYGVSFNENDKHIFNRIAHGRIPTLFISLYGKKDSAENKSIIAKAEALKAQRAEFPLNITYYDAESAEVWK